MLDFNKAIQILGLKPNFTKEELKKAHRKLSVENHPDKHKDSQEMNERQALINAARDYLSNYAKDERFTRSYFDIQEYVTQKIKDLESIINIKNSDQVTEKLFMESKLRINNIINMFRIDTLFAHIMAKQDIDKLYNQSKSSIKEEFEYFKKSFYTKYYIKELEVTETLNFDCTLFEFYNQLLGIKEKYSKERQINKRLENEIEKYQSYAGYERLELLVEACKNNALYHIKQNKFENIEEEIVKMHHQITTEVFEAYYSLKQKISNLALEVSKIDNEEIKNAYKNVKYCFEHSSFYDTEEAIKKLEEMIKEYREAIRKKEAFIRNREKINEIYRLIIDKYHESTKSHRITIDYNIVKQKTEIFNIVLELFNNGCEKLREIEYFQLLGQITFKSISEDKKIINQVTGRINSNDIKVYLKMICQDRYEEISFYCVINNKMYQINPHGGPVHVSKVDEELETNYISLEYFLNKSVWTGEYGWKDGVSLLALYRFNNLYLYNQGNRLFLSRGLEYRFRDDKIKDVDEKFKDKRVVYDLIKEQLKSDIEKYQKEEESKSEKRRYR